jgi:hypothetical protein
MRYYDLEGNWSKTQPFLDPQLEPLQILAVDFGKWTNGVLGLEYYLGDYPSSFDPQGREYPEWRRYVCPGACHCLVNFSLCLAQLVEPDKEWRIITSSEHSTVWDGRDCLFDLNDYAQGYPASASFRDAYDEEYPIGRYTNIVSVSII